MIRTRHCHVHRPIALLPSMLDGGQKYQATAGEVRLFGPRHQSKKVEQFVAARFLKWSVAAVVARLKLGSHRSRFGCPANAICLPPHQARLREILPSQPLWEPTAALVVISTRSLSRYAAGIHDEGGAFLFRCGRGQLRRQ